MDPSEFLIVGGTSGIGLEITRRLVDRGDRVTVIAQSAASGSDGALQGVTQLEADVTKVDFNALQLPQRLQGLVYCPGSIRLRPFQRLTKDEFEADWQINVMGAVLSIQACLPALKRADPPASIVLFSTVAVATGMPFHASIASAKGAVEGLVRSLAAAFAPRIRVNAIAPSLTDTRLTKSLLSNEGQRKAAADRHPLKRVGRPADSAAAALFLLGDDTSWITGQVLAVDGGMGALRTFK